MQTLEFTVKYVTVQNCFAYLPDSCQRQFTNANKSRIIKIVHQDREFYFSWHSRPSPDNSLRLSATFARALGIQENDNVLVSCDVDPGSVARVVVVPRNSQDLEIVELQSNRIQESLLDQINIVAVNQQIVVWISKFLSVVLTVESLEPKYKYGKLEMFTEIEISHPKNIENNENSKEIKSPKISVWNYFTNLMMPSKPDEKKVEESVENIVKKFSTENLVETFRILPLKYGEELDSMSTIDSLLSQPYNVFIHERFLPRKFIGRTEDRSKEFYCRVKKIRHNTQFVNKVSNTNFLRSANTAGLNLATEVIVRLFIIEDVLKKCSNNVGKEYFNDNSLHQSIYISENLRQNLQLRIGGKITLEFIEYSQQTFTAIEIFPQNDSVSAKNLEDYFQRYSKYNKVLINSSTKLILSSEQSCVIQFMPSEVSYALIDLYDLKNLPVHVREVVSNLENQMENLEDHESISLQSISTSGLKPILSECESVLTFSLGLDRTFDFGFDRENILICGKVGSGKTTICKILKKTYAAVSNFVYFHVINCKSLKGKKVETLHKTFLPAILDCVYHQPAILFIDDLDSIAGRTLDEEENTPDSINTARIADMLLNIITEYQAVHYVAVIATCTSMDKISQKLAAPRGIHLFRTVISISDFEKEDRVDILQLSLKSKLQVSNDVNWNHYGNKTEGWMPQDLISFAEKAVFTAWKRHVKSRSKTALILSDEDLSHGLENSTPMSLQGVTLYSGPGHAWSDIGGLAEVKQSLIELLHWPLKYPELFKNAPIKNQGGVLLYGAPGTGKTMLAGAIAKECGLSFISIKGPELLSKYIGASEEAVRNVFEKANSAKPCVLFFDEFDSLAPRRGHDSTGVTDRVVNQFLAQLDGVEGRQGVAVVAASSRPDLLDAALLRPGRLDKALLCSLPNEEEREEILAALCRSQKLDVTLLNLKNLAFRTTGFTGADLNAIISQGKLSALEENFAARKANGQKVSSGSMNECIVTQKHLIDALASTRPSLSPSEMSKYNRIYAKFSRAEDFPDELLKNNQRATLA